MMELKNWSFSEVVFDEHHDAWDIEGSLNGFEPPIGGYKWCCNDITITMVRQWDGLTVEWDQEGHDSLMEAVNEALDQVALRVSSM